MIFVKYLSHDRTAMAIVAARPGALVLTLFIWTLVKADLGPRRCSNRRILADANIRRTAWVLPGWHRNEWRRQKFGDFDRESRKYENLSHRCDGTGRQRGVRPAGGKRT